MCKVGAGDSSAIMAGLVPRKNSEISKAWASLRAISPIRVSDPPSKKRLHLDIERHNQRPKGRLCLATDSLTRWNASLPVCPPRDINAKPGRGPSGLNWQTRKELSGRS